MNHPVATAAGADHDWIGERALSKLRWRCRRGLLENDLFIERFFNHHAAHISVAQARGLSALMDLSDNDLLDLLLERTTRTSLDSDAALVLTMLRATKPSLSH